MTFEEFAAGRLPALLRFALVLTGNRADAEDVVQEVLVRAQARWAAIVAHGRPEAYIRRMVVNEFISARRRTWRLTLKAGAEELDWPTTPDPAGEHAERAALLAELAKLPSRQRAVLVLRYYEGLSNPEIAEVLGCEPVTVRGYVSRGLKALRIELECAAHDGAALAIREN